MCIIAVHKNDGTSIPRANFDECGRSNRDGFGMMYVLDGKLIEEHTMDYNEAWDLYQIARAMASNEAWMVLHWRLGTSGGKAVNMTHPFCKPGEYGIVHNGILTIEHDRQAESDTHRYFHGIVKPAVDKYGWSIIDNTAFMKLTGNLAGSDKIVFLNKENDLKWYNKEAGNEHEGVWYSNYGYRSYANYGYGNYSSSASKVSNKSNTTSATVVTETGFKCDICGKEAHLDDIFEITGYKKLDGKVLNYKDWESLDICRACAKRMLGKKHYNKTFEEEVTK